MKKHSILFAVLFTLNFILSQSIESQIREFARLEYPNDNKMQTYIYNKQITAYNYMLTVTDKEVKEIAIREYLNEVKS